MVVEGVKSQDRFHHRQATDAGIKYADRQLAYIAVGQRGKPTAAAQSVQGVDPTLASIVGLCLFLGLWVQRAERFLEGADEGQLRRSYEALMAHPGRADSVVRTFDVWPTGRPVAETVRATRSTATRTSGS